MSPLVTVYITNFNYGNFIREAIESVLSQTLKQFELIIIDDGSTDHSKKLIQEYENLENVSTIFQQNKGLNATNNVAITAAKGKYLIRLDADDYLHPDALAKMVARLESDNELGLVFPDYYYVDIDGELLGEEKRHNFQNEVVLHDQPAHGACTMIRLDFLKKVGGYNENYTCQDGYELWVKFIKHFKVDNISKPLFYYRQHGSNLTGDESKILNTRARINKDFIERNKISTKSLAIVPIRGGAQDLAFRSLGGINLLKRKVEQILLSRNVTQVVVTSPDLAVKDLLIEFESDAKVVFHERKQSDARYTQSLNPTIEEIVDERLSTGADFDVVTLLTLEFPFVSANKIDDVINTMMVFGSDSIIGVRSDTSVFYQHHGDGLHPILERDKYTKLEREALFKQVGGIGAVTKKTFLKEKKMIAGRVGHIMLDQRSSLGLFTKMDWEIAELLLQQSKDQ